MWTLPSGTVQSGRGNEVTPMKNYKIALILYQRCASKSSVWHLIFKNYLVL